ncbi:MAG TPA: ABC transporter permease [Aquabacterium sp.]|nr:ABC transporter permease [Aquabacterium sp.]
MFKLEQRPVPSRWLSMGSPFIALLITVVIGSVMFAWLGKDPVDGLRMFFWEPIKSAYAWSELSVKATPLILIALGLAVCFRANLWNIGAEGQFVLGAICGGGVAMQATPESSHGLVVGVLLAGALGGAAWAGVVAWLRQQFNTNEILVSLMLVYVAEMLLSYLVYGPWKDPQGYNFPQTITFLEAARVPKLVPGFRAHIGLVMAVVAVLGFTVFLFRTFAGFQLQVGGLAPSAARYAGFSSSRALWTAMLLSGAMAGLAGALDVAGPQGQLTPYVPMGYGFAAIIVAFVGRLNPLGIVFSAVLMSMFYIGGELAQSRLGLPKAMTGIFQGVLLFALLACDTFIHQRLRWVSRT